MAADIKFSSRLRNRAKSVRLILTDVDGVMTDGGITLSSSGDESKTFHVRDGLGIRLAQSNDIRVVFITARTSPIIDIRAREVGVEEIYQGAAEKIRVLGRLKTKFDLRSDEICYIGDDLLDLPVLDLVGFPAAVCDAHPEVLGRVVYVSEAAGGKGAVREVVEVILRCQGKWDKVMAPYASQPQVSRENRMNQR